MLRRETRLDWESEFRLRGVESDVRRGGHKNKRGKGIKRFGGWSITGSPNNVRLKPHTRNTFRTNAPPPIALTRHILRAQIITDHRRRGRRRNTTIRTSGEHNRNEASRGDGPRENVMWDLQTPEGDG